LINRTQSGDAVVVSFFVARVGLGVVGTEGWRARLARDAGSVQQGIAAVLDLLAGRPTADRQRSLARWAGHGRP
jgi:hypothetical protein